MKLNFKWHSNTYFGIAVILMGLYFFGPKLFTSHNSLIEINGQVLKVDTEYNWVRSRSGKSVKSELVIALEDGGQVYKVFENIGASTFNEHFENIKTEIQTSKTTSVWIKKSELNRFYPTVFQIEINNNEIVYSFRDAKELSRNGMIIVSLLGLFLIAFSQKKIGFNSSKITEKIANSNLILSVMSMLLILFFGLIAYSALATGATDLGVLFGGFTCVYLIALIYNNMKARK